MTEHNFTARVSRLFKGVALAAAGLASLGVGALLVSVNVETQQPEGLLLSWEVDGGAHLSEPLMVDPNGLPLRFKGDGGKPFPVGVMLDSGTQVRAFTVSVTPEDGVASVPMPAWFSGCQLAQLQTEGLPTLGVLITDGSTSCPSAPQIGLFEQFDIPTGNAPTTSVRDLLRYLSDVSARADLDRLPRDYRACLESDEAEIQQCLASLDSGPIATGR